MIVFDNPDARDLLDDLQHDVDHVFALSDAHNESAERPDEKYRVEQCKAAMDTAIWQLLAGLEGNLAKLYQWSGGVLEEQVPYQPRIPRLPVDDCDEGTDEAMDLARDLAVGAA